MAAVVTPARPTASRWKRPTMSERDHKIVRITGDNVQWSLDNGFSLRSFKKGEVFTVPDYVAMAMERRKVAKIITEAEIETQDAAETTIEMKDLRAKKE